MLSSNFVDTPGLRVHHLQAGTGEPVVFLHGFPQTSHQWRHQLTALSERGYACFAPDNRGFGRTDKPRQRISRGLLARDVVRFMDAVGLDSAHLVTHDWGGIIGFKVVADHPERVRSVTLLDTLCTVWHPRARHGYWFKAEGLAEAFFAEHHRRFIDVTFGVDDGAGLPAPPASPWRPLPTRGLLPGVDEEALQHYRDAFADPDSHHAAIQYYRYALPFHRLAEAQRDDGSTVERPQSLSEAEVAAIWLHPDGMSAHPDAKTFFDYGPEDRATRFERPAMWMYSNYLGAPGGPARTGRVETPTHTPFVAQFPRYFPHLETHAVAAGHFLPEEAAADVTTELLRFLPLR